MYKKFKKHLGYYISLMAILSLGLVLVLLTSPNLKIAKFSYFFNCFFLRVMGSFASSYKS